MLDAIQAWRGIASALANRLTSAARLASGRRDRRTDPPVALRWAKIGLDALLSWKPFGRRSFVQRQSRSDADARAWPIVGQPTTRIDARSVLVIGLSGANIEQALALIDCTSRVELVRFDATAPLAAAVSTLPNVGVSEWVPTGGFDRPWYDEARQLADSVVDAIAQGQDEADMRDALTRHRVALANKFKLDLIRDVGILEDVAALIRERPADAVLVVEGQLDASHIVDGIAETGAGDPARLFLFRRQLSSGRTTTPPAEMAPRPTGSHGAELRRAVDEARRRIRLRALRGSGVIVADFRNTRDFRYLGTAYPLIRLIGARRRVQVVQQRNAFTGKLLRMLVAAMAGPNRRRITLIPSAQAVGRSTAVERPADWMAGVAATLARRPETAGSFPVAVVRECCRQFARDYLPHAVALASATEEAFRANPPAYAIFVPDTQPFAMAVASGARLAGVPTIGVQTLMIGHSARDCRPICEWMACIDSTQRHLYASRFGMDEAHLPMVGNVDTESWREAFLAAGRQADSTGRRKRILFVMQPLPFLTETALAWLVAAVAAEPDWQLDAFVHPSATAATRRKLEGIVAAAGEPERIRIAGSGTPVAAIAAADVVANIVSNVGYKAAVMGKRVLVLDPTATGLPVRFHDMGLAVAAFSAEETAQRLRQMLDGTLDQEMAAARAGFLDRNPQLRDGGTIRRIVDFAETIAGSGTVAPRGMA